MRWTSGGESSHISRQLDVQFAAPFGAQQDDCKAQHPNTKDKSQFTPLTQSQVSSCSLHAALQLQEKGAYWMPDL